MPRRDCLIQTGLSRLRKTERKRRWMGVGRRALGRVRERDEWNQNTLSEILKDSIKTLFFQKSVRSDKGYGVVAKHLPSLCGALGSINSQHCKKQNQIKSCLQMIMTNYVANFGASA